MERLREQKDESDAQFQEDMNVKGLYYSGVKGDLQKDRDRDYDRLIAQEEAKFQYERFDRDVKRYGMAMQYALGAKAQEIQWSLGKAGLDLQQLDLALKETLGIGALQLQEQGLMTDFMMGMYNVAISQDTNDMTRQQIWLNTVKLLYELGVSDAEIDALYSQISGAPSAPAV